MTTKELTDVIEEGVSLKQVTQAYTEIASNKLKKIRAQVEKNRLYLNDLSKVHQLVKSLAISKKILRLKKLNKTISILITSNYHFYGSVNHNLIKFFKEIQQQHPTDSIIIGKTGLSELSHSRSVILENDYPSPAELASLVEMIKDYNQVLVFYSELQTVIIQKPTFQDITQTAYLDSGQATIPGTLFIFEPEIMDTLDFFETQVTSLLLQQTFLESELSRSASRLVAMDSAQINADGYIKEQKKLLSQAQRSEKNVKILQAYQSFNMTRGSKKWKG